MVAQNLCPEGSGGEAYQPSTEVNGGEAGKPSAKGSGGEKVKPNKALANWATGVNKLLALVGGLIALKFCLLKDHLIRHNSGNYNFYFIFVSNFQ